MALTSLFIISIIYLASRPQKVLDAASKVVTIATGSTVLYNNWIKDDSSGSGGEDENKKDKENKDDDTKDANKEENNKPADQDITNEK